MSSNKAKYDRHKSIMQKLQQDKKNGFIYEDLDFEIDTFMNMYGFDTYDLENSVCARRMLDKFLHP